MMSLVFSLLSQAKSTECLFKNLVLRSIISFFITNMLSKRSLSYTAKARGFALIAVTVNESRI